VQPNPVDVNSSKTSAKILEAQQILRDELQPEGWKAPATKSTPPGPGSNIFIAPGFNKETAVRGVTKYMGYTALAWAGIFRKQ
jgi:hypothetical protein